MSIKGKYIIKDKIGNDVIRYDINKSYTKAELKIQRADFENEAKRGKLICISDLFCTQGM